MNRSREHAHLLLRKSAEDQYVLERLIGEVDAPDAVIGFHAQQAVEKLLKAVLTSRSIRYGRTHDLDHLVGLLEQHGLSMPPGAERLSGLMPYAVEFRYDEIPLEAEERKPLDRQWALDCVQRVRAWADSILSSLE
jgi:HEPN domain-containing protein